MDRKIFVGMFESSSKNAFMAFCIFIRLLVSTEESLSGVKQRRMNVFFSLSSELIHVYPDIRNTNSHFVSIVESVNAMNLSDFF